MKMCLFIILGMSNSRIREMALLLLPTRQQLHPSEPPSSPSIVLKQQELQREVVNGECNRWKCAYLLNGTTSQINEMTLLQSTWQQLQPPKHPPHSLILLKLQGTSLLE
jgi:hypothetical protein